MTLTLAEVARDETFVDRVEPERMPTEPEASEPRLVEAAVVPPDPILAPRFEPEPLHHVDPFATLSLDLRFLPQERETQAEALNVLALYPAPVQDPTVEDESTSASFEEEPLYRPAPRYPANALRMKWEGSALCEIEVRSDGTVAAVTVSESSGHKLLDDAAVAAVLRWRFAPAAEATRVIPYRVSFELPNG